MFNKFHFDDALTAYKKHFIDSWRNHENPKWIAAACFQKNWDIQADNFSLMLKNSLSKTNTLLYSANFSPTKMIHMLAEKEPEEIRSMFYILYDENQDILERIRCFKNQLDLLLKKYTNQSNHDYQYETAISIYLWLHNPNKYYIYRYKDIKKAAEKLESDYHFKKGAYEENFLNSMCFYDEIHYELKNDQSFLQFVQSKITKDYFSDLSYKSLTVDFVLFISRHYDINDLLENEERYTKDDFLKQVYMKEEQYDTLVSLLLNKKNIILQGAPGVGKTYIAKRLAYSILGKEDQERIKIIQFHQNYTYEDFVMGYRPQNETFQLKHGIFYEFCLKASKDLKKKYFFIIDEINRGNLSKIFGELFMLIEKEYRDTKIVLAYNGTAFSVPSNLYIIGMMNTADRSIAMIDYALRRRFSFFEIEPGFETEGFKRYQDKLNHPIFNALIKQIIRLNLEIQNDSTLGAEFQVGHSYFCGQESCTNEWIKQVIRYDIIPLLKEYWFDEKQKVKKWEQIFERIAL